MKQKSTILAIITLVVFYVVAIGIVYLVLFGPVSQKEANEGVLPRMYSK